MFFRSKYHSELNNVKWVLTLCGVNRIFLVNSSVGFLAFFGHKLM